MECRICICTEIFHGLHNFSNKFGLSLLSFLPTRNAYTRFNYACGSRTFHVYFITLYYIVLRALRKFQGVLLRDLHRILYRDRPSHVQGLAEGHSGEIFLNHLTEDDNKPWFIPERSRRLRPCVN
jgi:hypothetical protein